MKYLLLIYSNASTWEAMSEPERERLMKDADTLMDELRESGEMLSGAALADPSQTRTIRVRDDLPAVTDGPYLEAKEHLAGVCVLECESPARAAALAARWPDARYAAVELRPIMDTCGGMEM